MRNKNGRLIAVYATTLETLDLANKLYPIIEDNDEINKLVKTYDGVELYLNDIGFTTTWNNLEISTIVGDGDIEHIKSELKISQNILSSELDSQHQLIMNNKDYIKFKDLEKIITNDDMLELHIIDDVKFIIIYDDIIHNGSLYRIYDEDLEKFEKLIELLGV